MGPLRVAERVLAGRTLPYTFSALAFGACAYVATAASCSDPTNFQPVAVGAPANTSTVANEDCPASSEWFPANGGTTPPVRMFRAHRHDVPAGRGNEIIIDFADPGSISIEFMAKMPGPEMTLGASKLSFKYEDSFAAANALEGYERLILLAMLGDQSLFTRADGIERVWEISEPLLTSPPPVEPYEPGTWGPDSVNKLIAPNRWYLH